MSPTPSAKPPLHGRTAIVTGGGRGIGRSIALAYARAGAHVVASAARGIDELERVAAEAETLPGRVSPVHADVADAGDVERLVQRALDAGDGRIDVLVNNAARGMRFVNPNFLTAPARFYEADPAAWRMVIETNVVGVFLVARAVVPHMVRAGCGRVINVTVNRATMTRPGFTPYGPSKAALEAMTMAWAAELEGTGVVVNLLAPGGATATGMIPDGVDTTGLLDPEIVVPGAIELAQADRSGLRVVATGDG